METGLVTVATFLTAPEAHIAKGVLEAEGIESAVQHENAATLGYWQVRVELQVKASDAGRAREILAKIR